MALCKLWGSSVSFGRNLSNAASMRAHWSLRYAFKSMSVFLYPSSVSNGSRVNVPSLCLSRTSIRRSASSSFFAQNEEYLTPSSKALRESSRESEPPSSRRTISSSFFRDVSNFSVAISASLKGRYYSRIGVARQALRFFKIFHSTDRCAAVQLYIHAIAFCQLVDGGHNCSISGRCDGIASGESPQGRKDVQAGSDAPECKFMFL